MVQIHFRKITLKFILTACLQHWMILKILIFSKIKKRSQKAFAQDKGQKEMVNIFLNSLSSGKSFPIPFSKIYEISKVSILANELLQERRRAGFVSKLESISNLRDYCETRKFHGLGPL